MIKTLTSAEEDDVMAIWLKTNLIAHHFIPATYWHEHYETVRQDYLPASVTYIAEIDGIITGFISILDNHFIGALFVDPAYQRQGIGRQLLRHCQAHYDNLSLGVYAENTGAVDFYQHCGFTIISEQDGDPPAHWEYTMQWLK